MKHHLLPLLGLVAALLLTGCMHGTRLSDFEPAHSPAGIEVTLRARTETGERHVQAELLAAQEDGLILLTTAYAVTLVPYATILDARFHQRRSLRIGAGRPPESSKLEQLRLHSRFPQGLEGETLQRLLALHGQDEMEVIQ